MLIVTTAVAASVTAVVTLADVTHPFQATLIRHHSLLSPSFPERVEDQQTKNGQTRGLII
jgi:hypothetical protein